MFKPARLPSSFVLAGALAMSASAAFAQSPDMQNTYSLRKGTCNNGAGGLVTISPGRIDGPGFECQLSDPTPAGTGLEAYTAACSVDGAEITDTMAFDLGNYTDHFEVAVPGRDGWLSLYPCGGTAATEASPKAGYQDYMDAVISAASMEDLFPYMSGASVDEMASAPAEERSQTIAMMKIFHEGKKDVDVVGETISGDTATVTANFCMDNMSGVETANLVLEDGVWKMSKSRMDVGTERCDGVAGKP